MIPENKYLSLSFLLLGHISFPFCLPMYFLRGCKVRVISTWPFVGQKLHLSVVYRNSSHSVKNNPQLKANKAKT